MNNIVKKGIILVLSLFVFVVGAFTAGAVEIGGTCATNNDCTTAPVTAGATICDFDLKVCAEACPTAVVGTACNINKDYVCSDTNSAAPTKLACRPGAGAECTGGGDGDCAFGADDIQVMRCVKLGNDKRARCVPKIDNIAVGTWCSEFEHCDTREGFFEFTCDKDVDHCVGAGHGIECSNDEVNGNNLLGKLVTDVPRAERCDEGFFCSLDEGLAGECKRDIGTEFIQDLGIGSTTGDIRDQIRRIINIVLGFLGIVGVIIVIYGGVVWMTALGEEDKVEKGKKTIIAGIIGLIIIGIAWTIVSYVINVIQGVGQ
jgi:hypothetical protein